MDSKDSGHSWLIHLDRSHDGRAIVSPGVPAAAPIAPVAELAAA